MNLRILPCFALVFVGILPLPKKAFSSDPSKTAEEDPADSGRYAERWRVLADLDGDGDEDLLLSEPTTLFGKMGGGWTVYLHQKDATFTPIGQIDAHPKALALEPDFDRNQKDPDQRVHVRIWVYLRGGGGWGTFGYFRVSGRTVEPLRHLEIYPGDAGTGLGQALYDATFSESPIPFRLQYSRTSPEGEVLWIDDK